jgi:hypothetical protein
MLRERILAVQPELFWFVAGLAIIAALAGFIGGFVFLRRRLLITGTPTSKIRSAAQGYVELEGYGELMDGEPIAAPLSGTACTWFRFRVDERETRHIRGRRENRWQTIERGTSDALFLLVDETGRCVIDPEGARVTPAHKQIWYGSTTRPYPGARPGPRLSFGQRFRFTEERMHPGDPLFALGRFVSAGGAGSAPTADTEIRDLIRVWKTDQAALLERFDTDRDGNINANEWQQLRAAAADEIMQGKALLPPTVDVLRRTNDVNRPFMLIARRQADLVRRLYWQAIGALVFAFAAGTGVFWAITQRL